jgi:hypothetical protein
LNPQQKAAREKSRGRFGIGDRKHGNSPQAAHGQGFGTGGDHQNRGVKKVRGAKPQGAYARTREEVEVDEVDMSMVDAVKEVLGHAGWAGLGNMPPVDPKTGKYVTGKSKIERLPDKKPKKQK